MRMMVVKNKECENCNQVKDVTLFRKWVRNPDGFLSCCNDCMQLPEVKKMLHKRAHKLNRDKKIAKTAEDRRIKKEKKFLEAPIRKEIARQKRIERQRIRNIENPEAKRASDKKYREENRAKRNEKDKERKSRDFQYRLTVNLRVRLNKAIENNQKIGSAIKDLGCTVDFLKTHLESLFKPGMTWNNYGKGPNKWQIDHKEALCLFDLRDREQFLKANNYINLQPMWHQDHIKKTREDIMKKRAA